MSGTVLFLDDDPGMRRSYGRMLRQLGYTPEMAADGKEAVDKLRDRSFDVIVSDVHMPGMGGIDFVRVVREHDLDVPVILVTGQPALDSAVAAMEHGVFRYLTKPVDLDKLGEVLRRAISMHRLARLKREALALTGAPALALADRISLDLRLTSALAGIWMAFQPIVRMSARAVYGYEALLRSSEEMLPNAAAILTAAERLGRLQELGRVIRARIAEAGAAAPDGALLFVNLHGMDLADPELYAPAAPLSRLANRVVLEITERASLVGIERLDNKVARLRQLGYRIAVDDLGAGYAGLASFAELDPELAKLDMSLVQGLDSSPRKRKVVEAMVRLCTEELGVEVIGEGIETAAESEALFAAGCDLHQGYHYARPERGFLPLLW